MEKRVVATLLTLMDGVSEKKVSSATKPALPNNSDPEPPTNTPRIVVMGATNRPNALDEALRRPGRFDREIEIGIPNAKARAEILTALLRKTPSTLTEAQIEHLASISHGYVGADLAAVCREAGLKTINRVMRNQRVWDMDNDKGGLEPQTVDLQGRFAALALSENAETRSSITDKEQDELKVSVEDMRAAMTDIKPSAMREIMIEVPKVFWSDIGGQAEIKQKLKESVEWPLQVMSNEQMMVNYDPYIYGDSTKWLIILDHCPCSIQTHSFAWAFVLQRGSYSMDPQGAARLSWQRLLRRKQD